MFFQNAFLLLFLEDRDMLCSQICPGKPISKPNIQTTKNCLPRSHLVKKANPLIESTVVN